MKKFGLIIVLIIFSVTYLFLSKDKIQLIDIDTFIDNEIKPNNYKKKYFGVSSSSPIAVDVGMEVMKNGGNAVDAAVAISYVLGVVEPYGSGIGGGGGMLIYSPNEEKSTFYNYREIAPYSSERKVSDIGVPGFVKGMEEVHNNYGVLSMKELIQPAIDYAEKGFNVNKNIHERLNGAQYRLPIKRMQQFYPEGNPLEVGDILTQKDLAKTLKKIQYHGSSAFYKGDISEDIACHTNITKNDLERYSVCKQEPVYGDYKGYEIISAPPPFSGITLIQILKLAEDIDFYYKDTVRYIDYMGAIINVVYNDRTKNIGDPLYYNSSYKKLLEEKYIKELSNKMNINEEKYDEEHESTTHFVVIDKDGMVVSCTNTLSNFFGSGIYVDGFFLNNTLSNISLKPSSPNYYEPGKRPRTFSTPTIITKDNEFIMGIGSPGGNRIPQVMTQVLLQYISFGDTLQKSIDYPRISFEDRYNIVSEKPLSRNTMNRLNSMGYNVYIKKSRFYFGGTQAMILDKDNRVYGGADYRRNGTWKSSSYK